ncbi:MAG: hypothetical protein OCD02_21475 [Spirochaetaceae bacterium]
MNRYSKITNKTKREIVLLKGSPCKWGKCTFCDYITDNSVDQESNHILNTSVLSSITGEFGVLEVINSGNIFELPEATLGLIKKIIDEKNIHTIFLESHWMYKNRIKSIRDFFGVKTIIKTGLETFDTDFRENVLVKGFKHNSIAELKSYFDSVCLMPGVLGQTKEMIKSDIQLAMDNFEHFTVNIYIANSTMIKPDPELIQWFQDEYKWLELEPKCDVLWVNTDFGVGD